MRGLVLVTLICLININQAFRLVQNPRHNEGVLQSLKVYFSTQTVEQTRTVVSTVTETLYNTCYATESDIVDCLEKKRDLDEGNDVDESLVESDPKVELNGEEISWESLISPSRVARDVEEVVEEVYPSDVQVVQPDQGEQASVVYASSIVEPESRLDGNELEQSEPSSGQSEPSSEHAEPKHSDDAEHEHSENDIDNSDDKVDEEDEEGFTTPSAEVDLYTIRISEDETTMASEDEATTMYPEVVIDADAAREAPEISASMEENWELTDVIVKMPGRSGVNCLEGGAENNGIFFTIFSTLYQTITEYTTTTVDGTNTVLFKSSGGCLPLDVQQIFTASCN